MTNPTQPENGAREIIRDAIRNFPMRTARQSRAADHLGTGWCDELAATILAALNTTPAETGGASEDTEGAAEREVGRWVYRRISALMNAKDGTPGASELTYLAMVAESVEEYGEEACADHALADFPSPPSGGARVDLCDLCHQPILAGEERDTLSGVENGGDVHHRCYEAIAAPPSRPTVEAEVLDAAEKLVDIVGNLSDRDFTPDAMKKTAGLYAALRRLKNALERAVRP